MMEWFIVVTPIEVQSYVYIIIIGVLLIILLVMEIINAIGNVHDVMASRNVLYHMYREQAAMLGQEYYPLNYDDGHRDDMVLVASDEELHQRRRLRKQRERERRDEIDAALLSKKVVAVAAANDFRRRSSFFVDQTKKHLKQRMKSLLPSISSSALPDDHDRNRPISSSSDHLNVDNDHEDHQHDNHISSSITSNNETDHKTKNNEGSSSTISAEHFLSSEDDDSSTNSEVEEEMAECERAAARLNSISNKNNPVLDNKIDNSTAKHKSKRGTDISSNSNPRTENELSRHRATPIPIFERRKSNIYVSLTEGAARRSSQRYSLSQRLCPEVCHICLSEYKEGEDICWSRNPKCIHAFHRDCIVEWLLMSSSSPTTGNTQTQGGLEGGRQHNEHDGCPCCRQSYFNFGPSSSNDKG